MATETIAYLIERQPQASPTKYLGVSASNSDSEERCSGQFTWLDSLYDALRFCRRLDAVVFIGAIRSQFAILPHNCTLAGLREGDPAPRVAEHMWVTNPLGAVVD